MKYNLYKEITGQGSCGSGELFGGFLFWKGDPMEFTVVSQKNRRKLFVDIQRVAIAGYSSRDIEMMMEQVGQLEKEHIQSPDYSELPSVYPVAPGLITQRPSIDVRGGKTSGEVEYLILKHGGEYYIGLGSDHTDREIEAEDIQKSKEVCMKPVAPILWEYQEIKDHLDRIRMVSAVKVGKKSYEYQEGKMDDLLPPIAIMNRVSKEMSLDDCLIFSGTIPLLREYRYGDKFACRLADDVLGREIELRYKIRVKK